MHQETTEQLVFDRDTILNMDIELLQNYFSYSFKNGNFLLRTLYNHGIITMKELTGYSAIDLLKLDGMERIYITQIKNALEAIGLSLSTQNREDKRTDVPKYNDPVLDTPVKEVVFTEDPTQNKTILYAFELAGIKYVGDLQHHTEASLVNYRLISVKRLSKVKHFLANNGISLSAENYIAVTLLLILAKMF